MNKESLDKTTIAIVSLLHELNIDQVDKLELMVNLEHFLSDDYENNIKILNRETKEKPKTLSKRRFNYD